jgi:hypothetical protein
MAQSVDDVPSKRSYLTVIIFVILILNTTVLALALSSTKTSWNNLTNGLNNKTTRYKTSKTN